MLTEARTLQNMGLKSQIIKSALSGFTLGNSRVLINFRFGSIWFLFFFYFFSSLVRDQVMEGE